MRKYFIVLFGLAALISGCQSGPSSREADETVIESAPEAGAETRGVGEEGGFSGMDLEGGAGPGSGDPMLDTLLIYFDYDSSDVGSDFDAVLEAHGRYLARNPGSTVRLEGHADERGSREYNIGLGERRAQSVRRILVLQGADVAQITTVSFGEERPAVFGSTEEAWQQNRRVELVYR
jgi:peptidoglycan-associated lipoprotein